MSLRDLREHFNFKFPRYIYTNNETCVDLYYYFLFYQSDGTPQPYGKKLGSLWWWKKKSCESVSHSGTHELTRE